MPRMRKVILTIEVETCLTMRELREVNFVCFGIPPMGRKTVRQVMPDGINHDCRGTIEQVQANVIKPTKKTAAEKKRWAEFAKADKAMAKGRK